MAWRLRIGTVVAAACAAAAWALAAGPAGAQPGLRLKLVNGPLAISAPAVRAVAGRAVTVTLKVTDARGTGGGWTLKLAAAKAVRVSRLVAACAPGSTCTLPASSGIGVSPTVLRARPASGMGVLRLTLTLAPLKTGAAVPVTFSVSR